MINDIRDAYRKARERHPGALIAFLSGERMTFIKRDGIEVSHLLGEPLQDADGYAEVSVHILRVEEFRRRLGCLGRALVGYKRLVPNGKWCEVSLDPPADVSRFVEPQRIAFADALAEIRAGQKQSHWIWYVFPQLKGLDQSPMSEKYGISDIKEARAFLKDEFLGGNLRTISAALLSHAGKNVGDVLGSADALKVRSSMTLFLRAAKKQEDRALFKSVLDVFYNGEFDQKTLEILLAPK